MKIKEQTRKLAAGWA